MACIFQYICANCDGAPVGILRHEFNMWWMAGKTL